MTVTHAWSGAVTPTGFKVKAKVTGGSIRLAVGTDEALPSPVFFGPVVPSNNIATLTATGLANDTRYYWAVEDGTLETARGKVRTHAPIGTPFSYDFAVISCAGASPLYPAAAGLAPTRLSNHPALAEIATRDPLFLVDLGDRHYYNIGTTTYVPDASLGTFRAADDNVLAIPNRAALHRAVPTVWLWDDHDYGPNDSDGSFVSKGNGAQVYRERVPSYTLPEASGPIYHGFQVGRVQFIASDVRYSRDPKTDPAPRTMLGPAQFAWLENILATSTSEALIWLNPQPSNSPSLNSWNAFPEERDAIYQMFGDYGWLGRMCELAGDEHQLAFDSGGSGRGYPLYTFSGLDSGGSGVGATYDLGKRASGGQRGHHGTVSVLDTGQWIKIETKGWYST